MLLRTQTSSSDPVKHLENLDFLNYSPWEFGDVYFRSRFASKLNGNPTGVIINAYEDHPNMAVYYDADDVLVLCGGMTQAQQAVNLGISWLSPTAEFRRDGVTDMLRSAANWLITRAPVVANPGTRRVTFIGHSLGGAVATVACAFATPHGRVDKRLYTYGAPRPMTASWDSQAMNYTFVRVWLAGDPVVRLPPHFGDATDWFVLQPLRVQRMMNSLKHQKAGIEITASGVMTAKDSANEEDLGIAFDVGLWLYGPNAFRADVHSLQAYLGAFSAASASIPQQTPTEPARQAEPRIRVTVPEERQRIQHAARNGSVTVTADIPAVAADIQSQVTVISGVRYRRGKRAGVRVVTYDDHIVAWCSGLRAQKKLVKELNRTLRA